MVTYLAWQTKRASDQAQQWAQQHGFTLVRCTRSWFPPLRLFWRISRSQVVMRIEVRGVAGQRKKGWLRVGNFWRGLWGQHEHDIHWDDQ